VLTVWGRPNSINVQKVLWTLAELEVPYAHITAGGDAGGLDTPEFRSLNPHGWVPVIEDRGDVVWESNAIVRFLWAEYGVPRSPRAVAEQDRWMDWSLAALQPAVMGLFWGYYRTPAAQRDDARNQGLIADCRTYFETLEAWLSGRDYLCGEDLSMADIPAGALLYRYFEMGLDPPRSPSVSAWYGKLAKRPGYRTHIMKPFPELYGRLAF
jgi:glutathione S-transferase